MTEFPHSAGENSVIALAQWYGMRYAGGVIRFVLYNVLLPLLAALPLLGWQQAGAPVPEPVREFRAAWVATVFNLDWPSRAGLSAGQQKAELLRIIQEADRLRLNALILQVRPNSDAVYASRLEPWSAWLSGAGTHPGYDPLAFAIAEAHKRGIEIHAWFNPFRATVSNKPVGRGHVARSGRHKLLKAGSTMMLNPSSKAAQQHVLGVVTDVVRRYDVDGVHLDDYFYPYPPHHNVADGRTPAQRRAVIDSFVQSLYRQVKALKPWVRVGISPFGIWQPGYPAEVEAGVNAYEHLACDARKWLELGWVDYLAPQLYWRCKGPQSFPALMEWWSGVNPSRPVWPGIASVRIDSKEDPGRPASEIGRQIAFSRKLARQSSGQLFWSWKSLGTNRGGVQRVLQQMYPTLAVPPPMPWSGSARPARPGVSAAYTAEGCRLSWRGDGKARKWVVQVGSRGRWFTMHVLPGNCYGVTLPRQVEQTLDRIAVRPISATGMSGEPGVLVR